MRALIHTGAVRRTSVFPAVNALQWYLGTFADDQIGDTMEQQPQWHHHLALLAGAAILATLRPTSFPHGRNIFVARNIWRELTLVCDADVIRKVSHAQGQCCLWRLLHQGICCRSRLEWAQALIPPYGPSDFFLANGAP